jgi:hypothetical protein
LHEARPDIGPPAATGQLAHELRRQNLRHAREAARRRPNRHATRQ